MRIPRAAIIAAVAVMVMAGPVTPPPRASAAEDPYHQWIRQHVVDQRMLSPGAQAWVFGSSVSSGDGGTATRATAGATPSFGSNVDANDPNQDFLHGQTDPSVAVATGYGPPRVLAVWGDASGSVAGATDSTLPASSLTGVALSTDGGASFTDLVGLPNPDPRQQWFPGATALALDPRHFLVVALYYPKYYAPCSHEGERAELTIAVSAVDVDAAGQPTFHDPVRSGHAGDVCTLYTPAPDPNLAYLDHPSAAYDPTTRTLVIAYTRFYFFGVGPHSGFGQIELVRAHVPAVPANLRPDDFGDPVVVWSEEAGLPALGGPCAHSSEETQCGAFNGGTTLAVAPGGDAYVAWERNIVTNLPSFGSDDPFVYVHGAVAPPGATAPSAGGKDHPVVLTRDQGGATVDGGVRSLDTQQLAGYDGGGGNDNPDVAFDAGSGRPLFAWADASHHALGDVWLRGASPDLKGMGPISRVNDRADSALHFLPGISSGGGRIAVSWYDRSRFGPDSSVTDYVGELRSRATRNEPDFLITTGPTDWANMSASLVFRKPSHTENVTAGGLTYFTWTDGRIGVPQPFVDRFPHT